MAKVKLTNRNTRQTYIVDEAEADKILGSEIGEKFIKGKAVTAPTPPEVLALEAAKQTPDAGELEPEKPAKPKNKK